jgi:DNA-directed RNA polymerase subunit alpha
MLDFQMPQITHEEVSATEGVFVVEPLERGFGYTFGNSLRRVLLSSLEGAAVTSVRIEGAQHEFTTVEGVREDVTDIILNLKGLVLGIEGDAHEVEADIVKSGPGVVTAADIAVAGPVEILNKDLVICNLAAKAKLEMSLTIGRGRGYVPASENKDFETTIGVIPVDSIFSPVRRVTYTVEPARVGSDTDFDKLTLHVKTNGAIDPKDAVTKAAEILIRQLNIFANIDTAALAAAYASERTVPEYDAAPTNGMEHILIEELELGVRSYNCLKRVGIETVGDLVAKSDRDLAAIPNFGRKSIDEIRAALGAHGLRLRGDEG